MLQKLYRNHQMTVLPITLLLFSYFTLLVSNAEQITPFV